MPASARAPLLAAILHSACRVSIPATFWRRASGLGLAVFGGYLLTLTAAELDHLWQPQPPRPPEVARDIVVPNVSDADGRRASFRILLFTDEFRWRINSHEALEDLQARPEFSAGMREVLNGAEEIICVGASSEELPAGLSRRQGRAQEERRAARRAEQIAIWVRRALGRPIPIRKLNVGHHAPTGRAGDTSDQRRVVIVLVLDQDEDTNIDQALRVAMARESVRAPIFETLLTQYSLARGPEFTWVD